MCVPVSSDLCSVLLLKCLKEVPRLLVPGTPVHRDTYEAIFVIVGINTIWLFQFVICSINDNNIFRFKIFSTDS